MRYDDSSGSSTFHAAPGAAHDQASAYRTLAPRYECVGHILGLRDRGWPPALAAKRKVRFGTLDTMQPLKATSNADARALDGPSGVSATPDGLLHDDRISRDGSFDPSFLSFWETENLAKGRRVYV